MAEAKLGKKDHLYLVDGSGYIFRAYHALPPLTRKSDGLPVGAVSGFCNMLLKLLNDMGAQETPTHLAVIFDASGKSFRNEIYPDYKAHRPPAPEDLVPQFPLVREAVEAFDIPAIELEGFEADDLIAAYADAAAKQGTRVTIVSSDKDLMQLVNDKIEMVDTMKDKCIDTAGVVEKFGVRPDRVIDVQALAGDSVDNVPGVPGIGVKTAAELINQFGDLDTLLAQAETIKQPKRRENLIQFAEQARISRQLVYIKDDVDVPLAIDGLVTPQAEEEKLMGFLAEQGFKSLIAALGGTMPAASPAMASLSSAKTARQNSDIAYGQPDNILPPVVEEADHELVTDMDALERWIAIARGQGFVAIDTETTSLDAARAELVGVAMATSPGKGCYIPLRHIPAGQASTCLLYTSPSPRDLSTSRMPSSA